MEYEIVNEEREPDYVTTKRICDACNHVKGSYGTWKKGRWYEKADGEKTRKGLKITFKVSSTTNENEFRTASFELKIPLEELSKEDTDETAQNFLEGLRGKWVCGNAVFDAKEEAEKNMNAMAASAKSTSRRKKKADSDKNAVWQIPEDFLILSRWDIISALDKIKRYDTENGICRWND